MTAQETAVETFRRFIQETTSESVTVGLLPVTGGIAVQIVTGKREYASLSSEYRRSNITLDVLSKNKDQSRAYGSLCSVANACETAGLTAPIVNATVDSEPLFVGKDGEYWIYSLSVSLRVEI